MSNDTDRMNEILGYLHAADRARNEAMAMAATREAELNAAVALIAGFRATVAEQRAEIERLREDKATLIEALEECQEYFRDAQQTGYLEHVRRVLRSIARPDDAKE